MFLIEVFTLWSGTSVCILIDCCTLCVKDVRLIVRLPGMGPRRQRPENRSIELDHIFNSQSKVDLGFLNPTGTCMLSTCRLCVHTGVELHDVSIEWFTYVYVNIL